MELKPSQSVALDELITHIKEGEKRVVLKGSAGTGKTFLTNALIKRLKQPDLYEYGAVYVTAPTHKALTVLKGKIDEKPYLEFLTIQSALKMKRKIDLKTGKESFVPEKFNPKNPPFRGIRIVLLDEASMLPFELIFGKGGIKEYPNILFIFIGDEKQLPPVNELDSPVFTQGWPTVTLTEIIRQGEGSPIIELSNNLRLINTGINGVISSGDGYYFENMQHRIIDRLAEVNGTDDIKYLAYIGKEVSKMNEAVRRRIYGSPKIIELGESLIFNSPYSIGADQGYKNNEEVKVRRVEVTETMLFVPTAQSQLVYENGVAKTKVVTDGMMNPIPTEIPIKMKVYIVNEHIKVLHEDSYEPFIRILKSIVSDCQKGIISWPLKYWFEEQVANITYNHAITVHKSQGSTYGIGIVDVGNINFNRDMTEKAKMLYTGITRASNKVVLYNTRGLILH